MRHDLLTCCVDTNGARYRGMLALPTAEDGGFPPVPVHAVSILLRLCNASDTIPKLHDGSGK
jgi:hypothetical protein